MTCSADSMLKDGSLNAGGRCPRDNLVVGDVIHPTDMKAFFVWGFFFLFIIVVILYKS